MEKKQQNNPKTTGDESANVNPWGIGYSQLFPLMTNEPAPVTGDTSVENREEEIVALRGWNLVVDSDSRYVLKSPGRGIVLWPKREPLKAECIPAPVRGRPDPYRGRPEPRPTHDSPGVRCWCGAYGLKAGVREAMGWVAGEVYLFGGYVEQDLGYRAQYAYPKNLTWFKCSWCGQSCRMNDLEVLRRTGVSPQMRLHQVCTPCLDGMAGLRYGTKTDLVPLSYVIEEMEYEYDLEVL